MRPFFKFLIVVMLALAGVTALARNIPQGELQRLQGPAAETIVSTPIGELPPGVSPTPTQTPTAEPNGIDTTPPQILSIKLEQSLVDTFAQSQAVTITLHITDDLSGFANAKLRFVPAAGGTQAVDFWVDSGMRANGDRRDGIYIASATIPKYAVYGRWYLSKVYVSDNANNSYQIEGFEYGIQPQEPLPPEVSPASISEPIYFVNGKDDGEPVYPQPETVVPPPGPLPPEDGVSADATPWAGDMFLPSLGQ